MIYRQKQSSLTDYIDKYQVKGFLVFRTAKTSFFKWLLPAGFGHVFAVIERPGYSILIDSSVSHCVAKVYSDIYHYDQEEGDTVLKFNRNIDIKTRHYGFGFISCVEVVKRFIGVNKHFVCTPKQLYEELS